MKRHLSALLSCLLLLAVTGCKDKNTTPQSLKGNEARPTWTAPDEYDYSSSLAPVLRLLLEAQYPTRAADFTISEDDLLAAFAGNQCLGVTEPQDGLFYLFIAGPDTEEQTTGITLRYWSAHYTNLFVAENAFPFVNDDQKGTIAEPFVPVLKLDR